MGAGFVTAAPAAAARPSPTSPQTHGSTLHEPEATHEPTTPTATKGALGQKSSEDNGLEVKKDTAVEVKGGGRRELEEEAICGFRLFMKDQGFYHIAVEEWKKCMEECLEKKEEGLDSAEGEAVKCFNVATLLKRCLEADPDYCGPLLQAEKAARKEELEKLKESEKSTEESATVSAEVSQRKDGGTSVTIMAKRVRKNHKLGLVLEV